MINTILKALSATGLILTLVAPFLFLFEAIDLSLNHHLLAAGMILWFAGAVRLIRKPSAE